MDIEQARRLFGTVETKQTEETSAADTPPQAPQRPQPPRSVVFVTPAQLERKGLAGLSFAVTGKLSLPRSEIIRFIKEHGGIYSYAVSSEVNFLVVGVQRGTAIETTKIRRAKEFGVETITEEDLIGMAKYSR